MAHDLAIHHPEPITVERRRHHRVSGDAAVWLTFWTQRPLPILQATKDALAELSSCTDFVRVDQLSALALTDPLLVAYALRHVNQRRGVRLAGEIISIEHVLLLMGVQEFIHTFSQLPSIESILLPKYPHHYQMVLQEIASARLTARLIDQFGALRYDARPEEIIVTALLARLPYLLSWLEPKLEEVTPNVDWAKVTLPLFSRWRLPLVLNTLLSDKGELRQRAVLQQELVQLVHLLHNGWWQKTVNEQLALIARTLGITKSAVWAIVLQQVMHQARHDWEGIYSPLVLPARWLPMLPGDWPPPQPAPVEVLPPSVADQSIDVMLTQIQQKASQSNVAFSDLVKTILRAIADGLDLTRVYFGLVDENHRIQPYQVHITSDMVNNRKKLDDPLQQWQLDLRQTHLFTAMMIQQQSIWFNYLTRQQFDIVLPKDLAMIVGDGDFFAASIFVGDNLIGLIYADDMGRLLSAAQFKHFQNFTDTAMQCLAQHTAPLSSPTAF